MYNWIQKGQQAEKGIFNTFFYAFKKAESVAALSCLQNINDHAQRGNWQCSAWLLERRHGYHKNVNHNRSHMIAEQSTDKKAPLQSTENLLIEQAQQLKEAIAKAEKSESWQAYAALQRQLLAVSMQIKHLSDADIDNQYTDMEDEKILNELVDMIESLPPMMQERLVNNVAQLKRHPLHKIK